MNFFEMLFYFLFGFGFAFLAVSCHILLNEYRRKIYQKSTICPICGKSTINQTVCNFRRKGKIYHVHCGKCADIFLYGKEFYEKRFLDTLDKSIKNRFGDEN